MRGNNLAGNAFWATGRSYARIPAPALVLRAGTKLVLVPAGLRRNVHARPARAPRSRSISLRALSLKHVAAVLERYRNEYQDHAVRSMQSARYNILLRDRLETSNSTTATSELQSSLSTQQ